MIFKAFLVFLLAFDRILTANFFEKSAPLLWEKIVKRRYRLWEIFAKWIFRLWEIFANSAEAVCKNVREWCRFFS